MMMKSIIILDIMVMLSCLFLPVVVVQALSSISSSSSSSSADTTRSRLAQALSSPSTRKLTYSPEICIMEPNDPTALLLQSNAIETLSQRIRDSKANIAFISCDDYSSLKTFVQEQETSRGNFPGPVPVVFCPQHDNELDLNAIAGSGADGIVIPVEAAATTSDTDSSNWIRTCKSALESGLQPIPEITFSDENSVGNDYDIEQFVDNTLSKAIGCDPVCVLLTVPNPTTTATTTTDDDDDESGLPLTIPASLSKRIPILGSIREPAGENRLGVETGRYKDAGFSGCVLRSECLPGFDRTSAEFMQKYQSLDVEIVSQFWSSVIADLKSVKSKNFAFRSKNNMEKSAATRWVNYQSNVIDSGALGDPNDTFSISDDAAANGDYQGFA